MKIIYMICALLICGCTSQKMYLTIESNTNRAYFVKFQDDINLIDKIVCSQENIEQEVEDFSFTMYPYKANQIYSFCELRAGKTICDVIARNGIIKSYKFKIENLFQKSIPDNDKKDKDFFVRSCDNGVITFLPTEQTRNFIEAIFLLEKSRHGASELTTSQSSIAHTPCALSPISFFEKNSDGIFYRKLDVYHNNTGVLYFPDGKSTEIIIPESLMELSESFGIITYAGSICSEYLQTDIIQENTDKTTIWCMIMGNEYIPEIKSYKITYCITHIFSSNEDIERGGIYNIYCDAENAKKLVKGREYTIVLSDVKDKNRSILAIGY